MLNHFNELLSRHHAALSSQIQKSKTQRSYTKHMFEEQKPKSRKQSKGVSKYKSVLMGDMEQIDYDEQAGHCRMTAWGQKTACYG